MSSFWMTFGAVLAAFAAHDAIGLAVKAWMNRKAMKLVGQMFKAVATSGESSGKQEKPS